MTEKPRCPADPRGDEPYYIDSDCPECGTPLEQNERAAKDGWYDEWECPSCQDGIHMDWPDAEYERIEERMEEATESLKDTIFKEDE